MTSLFTADQIADFDRAPISEGDAGIILKADGSFQVFTTGHIDPKAMTSIQLDQGKTLMAFTLALRIPQIMDLLVDLANQPDIAGDKAVDLSSVMN